MGIVYVLNLVWLLMLCCLVIITSTFTVFWAICSSDRILVHDRCIDFTQFGNAGLTRIRFPTHLFNYLYYTYSFMGIPGRLHVPECNTR